MVDYKSMYLILFNAMSNAINVMRDAQQQAEEIFLAGEETANRNLTDDAIKN